MTSIDASALRRDLSPRVKTGNGNAYLDGSVRMPDPLLAELFDDVAAALAKVEETNATARELQAELNKAIAARAEHKNHEDAVYTSDQKGLVFTDPVGVKLQNAVKAAEKAIRTHEARAKAALLDYVVTGMLRQADAKDEALARALAADAEANAAAEALTAALEARERFWALAGQPYPGVDEDSVLSAAYERVLIQHQRQADLRSAVDRVLPFPLKQEAGN